MVTKFLSMFDYIFAGGATASGGIQAGINISTRRRRATSASSNNNPKLRYEISI